MEKFNEMLLYLRNYSIDDQDSNSGPISPNIRIGRSTICAISPNSLTFTPYFYQLTPSNLMLNKALLAYCKVRHPLLSLPWLSLESMLTQ